MNTDILLQNARRAARALTALDDGCLSYAIHTAAQAVAAAQHTLLEANAADLALMAPADPKRDRLLLTPSRLDDIVTAMHAVADMPSPIGRVIWSRRRPNGMVIDKVTVPFGVIGVIYEARPNVTFDVFALTLKAGSACVLKGGHEAQNTNSEAVRVITQALTAAGLPPDVLTLLPPTHEAATALMEAQGLVDVIIPRGSRRLIDHVRTHARVPVIETGAGVCHTYLHSSGKTEVARNLVVNAKTRRVSVCNALDTFIIDVKRLADLPAICAPLADKHVEIYADGPAFDALRGYPLLRRASDGDFGREWLDYKMSVKSVNSLSEAMDFIEQHGSRHSECIVAEDGEAIERFLRGVDAACVYANVSTAFTDGGEFGFGAEIGISTQKLHARGPMALPEITTYKYLIRGAGQTR